MATYEVEELTAIPINARSSISATGISTKNGSGADHYGIWLITPPTGKVVDLTALWVKASHATSYSWYIYTYDDRNRGEIINEMVTNSKYPPSNIPLYQGLGCREVYGLDAGSYEIVDRSFPKGAIRLLPGQGIMAAITDSWTDAKYYMLSVTFVDRTKEHYRESRKT